MPGSADDQARRERLAIAQVQLDQRLEESRELAEAAANSRFGRASAHKYHKLLLQRAEDGEIDRGPFWLRAIWFLITAVGIGAIAVGWYFLSHVLHAAGKR